MGETPARERPATSVELPAEPAGRSRHGACKRRKRRAGPARGLAVRSADE